MSLRRAIKRAGPVDTAGTEVKVFDFPLFKRIMKLVQPYKGLFYASATIAIVLALLAPARPYLISLTVNEYILKNDWTGLQIITIIIVALLFIESALRYAFLNMTNLVGQSIIRDLRIRVFHHIINLRLRYFDRTPIGRMVTRSINDIESINQIFSQGVVVIISDALTIVVVIFVMFYINWQLAIITLTPLPLLILSTYIFQKGVKKASDAVRTQVANLNSFLQEHISGMSIVQVFGREQKEFENFKKINKKHKQAHIQTIWYYSIFFPVVEIFSAVSIGLLVWWGGYGIVRNFMNINVGDLIGYLLYIYMLFRPIRQLADRFGVMQMGLVASERVFKVLDTEARIENSGTYAPEKVNGAIEFDNVWFAYNDENYVLKGISFKVNPGETLAIVGATGAGKTSVINILSRFYDINKGHILIDGTDIREFDLRKLRAHIGLVLQDVFLFSDTIAENIRLNNQDISIEEIEEAAKMLGADEFIRKLPDGYHYNVKERGATLSLGQRQIIAFIRALVYNPEILILDEATSNIDTESEILIQKATEKLVKNRTSIIIAHRLSTIRHAQKIMVLDKGEIKEFGTHEELLEIEGGYFRKLYETQFQVF